MAACVDAQAELGSPACRAGSPGIGVPFVTCAVMPAALFIVPRTVVSIIKRRIDRAGKAKRMAYRHPAWKPVHQTPGPSGIHEPVKGTVECIVIGNLPHADVFTPMIPISQQRFDAAEALLLMLANDQAGE